MVKFGWDVRCFGVALEVGGVVAPVTWFEIFKQETEDF
jgi:hypothetical protein